MSTAGFVRQRESAGIPGSIWLVYRHRSASDPPVFCSFSEQAPTNNRLIFCSWKIKKRSIGASCNYYPVYERETYMIIDIFRVCCDSTTGSMYTREPFDWRPAQQPGHVVEAREQYPSPLKLMRTCKKCGYRLPTTRQLIKLSKTQLSINNQHSVYSIR